MGLEATWSLVDIPADARDAAQAAARREGVSVGEWLTRRILKRFSELNLREQEQAFATLRNHVSQLANRLDRFEDDSRAEPMREALKKLHQGLARLNDELVSTAGHSAIQISQLSNSLDSLNGRVDELRDKDVESRGAFERRMAQLQEFVEGMNLRHAAETRAIASRMDALGGTMAESRRLIADERTAIDRLEETLAKTDARYGNASRALKEKCDSLSETIQRVGTTAAASVTTLDQRIVSLQTEVGEAATRQAEQDKGTTTAVAKLHGKLDDLQADVTGMCGALDRRVLLSQQALQSLDARQAQSVESITAQLETVKSEAAQVAANLETRVVKLEGFAKDSINTVTGDRFAILEQQLNSLAERTDTATSAASAALPKTEALEAQLAQLNQKLQTEVEVRQNVIEQLKANVLEQTLTSLGEKLEAEGRKQQAAIADLKHGLLIQLSQAFDERAATEEQKQQDAIAQLQAAFASALHTLGETFESQGLKQQEAIAELKANLTAAHPISVQLQANEPEPVQNNTADLEQPTRGFDSPTVHFTPHQDDADVPAHPEESPSAEDGQHDLGVLDLTTLADASHEQSDVQNVGETGHAEVALNAAESDLPPFAAHTNHEMSHFEMPKPDGLDHLATAAMTAHYATEDSIASPSYLSAARQSLQAAAVRSDSESSTKALFGLQFVKSLALGAKQKGRTTSYALIAGIALVAILAIIVGAAELTSRSGPTDGHAFTQPFTTPTKATRVARYVAPKTLVAPSVTSPVPQDRTTALAKGGDAQAQLQMGIHDLARNNTAEAGAWLERAARQGSPVAQYRLATLYASGRGMPTDKSKAFHWYLAAAQAGNRKAMSNLAVAYAQGDGTTKNPQEAGRWLLKAAQLGLADAQFDLAILYERGLGVPQNLTDAYRWYVIAARTGDKESKDRVEALSSQLTADDRAAAETAAAEFKPQPMNARANEPQ